MRSARWSRSSGVLLGSTVLLVWIMVALGVSVIVPRGPDVQRLNEAFQPPSPGHLFGTDDLGRDVLTRVMYGARFTLPLAFAVVVLAGAGGTLLGALSGYLGGWFDEGVMRLTELVMAFPAIVLAMAIVVALGPGLINAGLAMVVVWWPPYARLARGEVLALRHLEFVEAAAALGQTSWGIFRRAVLPGVLPSIMILATIDMGAAIVTGSGLSFLGLGATPPTPEWGAMVSAGQGMLAQWWVATFPGLAIFVTVVAFNFMGDGIRDILDPRQRRRG